MVAVNDSDVINMEKEITVIDWQSGIYIFDLMRKTYE